MVTITAVVQPVRPRIESIANAIKLPRRRLLAACCSEKNPPIETKRPSTQPDREGGRIPAPDGLATVVNVTVAFAVPDELSVTLPVTVQVVAAGAEPLAAQVKATGPANPFWDVSFSATLAVVPAAVVRALVLLPVALS